MTRVVQLGAPDSREQYVHRTGRTGRAGKAGQAVLLLADWEERPTLSMLKGLPIQRRASGDVKRQRPGQGTAKHDAAAVRVRFGAQGGVKLLQSWDSAALSAVLYLCDGFRAV